MRDIVDTFSGCFGDFATMFMDTDLDSYVIRGFYTDKKDGNSSIDGEARYKVVIGYTELANDILLHLVDAECTDTWDELNENGNKYGVTFELLSQFIGEYGFEIIPRDQLEWEDEDEDTDEDEGYSEDVNEEKPECKCEFCEIAKNKNNKTQEALLKDFGAAMERNAKRFLMD